MVPAGRARTPCVRVAVVVAVPAAVHRPTAAGAGEDANGHCEYDQGLQHVGACLSREPPWRPLRIASDDVHRTCRVAGLRVPGGWAGAGTPASPIPAPCAVGSPPPLTSRPRRSCPGSAGARVRRPGSIGRDGGRPPPVQPGCRLEEQGGRGVPPRITPPQEGLVYSLRAARPARRSCGHRARAPSSSAPSTIVAGPGRHGSRSRWSSRGAGVIMRPHSASRWFVPSGGST